MQPPRASLAPRSRSAARALPPVVAGVLVVAALAAAPLLGPRPGTPPRTPPDTASSALDVPAAVSARFARALAASRPPQVARYLRLHPAARPPDLASATWAAVEEHQGSSAAMLALHPDAAAGSGGRVTVVVVTDRSRPLRWSTHRTAVRQDHRQYEQTVGMRTVRPRPGVPESTVVRYDGAAPTTLRIDVADGVR